MCVLIGLLLQCKLYWQNQGDFLCVKVDRHTKTKKSIFCNLEIFRVREKDYPVEVVELKGACAIRLYKLTSVYAHPLHTRHGYRLLLGAQGRAVRPRLK